MSHSQLDVHIEEIKCAARQEGIKEGMERAAKMIEASPKDTSLLALAAALRALIIMEARDHLEQRP